MKLMSFTAKCQDATIREQYKKYGVKCFDLRLNTYGEQVQVVHGKVVYNISLKELRKELRWLDYRRDVSVRILLDIRDEKHFTPEAIELFRQTCKKFEKTYKSIKFWCGRNLYNWAVTYHFEYEPSCEEKYSSVCAPKWLDDWYPRWFAKKNNQKIYSEGTDKEFLLMDFVNYIE